MNEEIKILIEDLEILVKEFENTRNSENIQFDNGKSEGIRIAITKIKEYSDNLPYENQDNGTLHLDVNRFNTGGHNGE